MSSLVHLTFEARGRRVLCADASAKRRFLHTIVRVVHRRLLLFGFAADHGHLVVHVVDKQDLGHLQSAVSRAASHCTAPLAKFHVEAIDDADHLGRLVGYGPRQCWKHHLADDPLLYLGSHLPDVLGCRILQGFDPRRIASEAPGVDLVGTVLRGIGVRESPVGADDALVRRLGASTLWDAARDALAIGGRGRSPAAWLAVRVFVQVGREAAIDGSELRYAAGLGKSAYHRARRSQVEARISDAVRMRLGVVALAASLPRDQRPVPSATPGVVWCRSDKPPRRG